MNYTHLIDTCQAHLAVQQASTLNSFVRSETGVVIDSEPQPSCTCKTSFLFALLAVLFRLRVPFFDFTLRINRLYLYFKYLNNKVSIYYIFIIKCKYKLQASLTLQETQSIHDSMNIPKIKLIKIVGERR